ncbi:hypothetical protein J1N35_040654, partial [Gossypium stocksii]
WSFAQLTSLDLGSTSCLIQGVLIVMQGKSNCFLLHYVWIEWQRLTLSSTSSVIGLKLLPSYGVFVECIYVPVGFSILYSLLLTPSPIWQPFRLTIA